MDALLRSRLDELTRRAREFETAINPGEGLTSWFREGVAFVRGYNGVVDLMAKAIADPNSALHVSCSTVRAAGAALLIRAQESGAARTDIDGTDLFALMGALGWISDQPSFTPRADHLTFIISNALAPSMADPKSLL